MDSTEDDHSAKKLQRKILAYMVEHPEAKDTAAGIIKWWLAGFAGNSEVELRAALDDLLQRGWVTATRYGQTVIYGFDKTHMEKVREFLRAEADG
jgi:DNA-binding transcriptional regulator PaaX